MLNKYLLAHWKCLWGCALRMRDERWLLWGWEITCSPYAVVNLKCIWICVICVHVLDTTETTIFKSPRWLWQASQTWCPRASTSFLETMYGCSVLSMLSYMYIYFQAHIAHIYFQAQVNNIKTQAGEKISDSLRRHLCSGWTRQNGRTCGGHGFVSRNVSATHTLETNKNKQTHTHTITNTHTYVVWCTVSCWKEVVSWHATR